MERRRWKIPRTAASASIWILKICQQANTPRRATRSRSGHGDPPVPRRLLGVRSKGSRARCRVGWVRSGGDETCERTNEEGGEDDCCDRDSSSRRSWNRRDRVFSSSLMSPSEGRRRYYPSTLMTIPEVRSALHCTAQDGHLWCTTTPRWTRHRRRVAQTGSVASSSQ